MNYLAITPARDEENFLPALIDSMCRQTRLPARWIIVNDGSRDATARIIDEAARAYPWIEPRHFPADRPRLEGGESILKQFMTPSLADGFDYILRVDADLSFAPTMVECLLREFAADPRLGIGGATLYEPSGDTWREVRTPAFHTRGAVKLYSAPCFRAIGGIDAGLGWDTLDEAAAMLHGFRTRSFPHIQARHHRPQGAAGGLWRGRLAAGRAAYRVGYSPLFMIVRALARITEPPYVLGSFLMAAGFLEGYLRGLPRAASAEVMKFIRTQQRRRLLMMDTVWR